MATVRGDIAADITATKGIAPPANGEIAWVSPKKPACGRPRIPVLAMLGAALALVAGLAPAASVSSAASPVPGQAVGSTPDDGVVGNAPYCCRDYERLDGDLYIAYNDDSGDYTCVQTTDQQKANGFRVTTFNKDILSGVGAFPNIFAGFEWGRHPKNSFLPVEESQDGNPLAAVSRRSPGRRPSRSRARSAAQAARAPAGS
jgi:hypothetical protein